MTFFNFILLFAFLKQGSHASPRTHSVGQVGLELAEIHLALPLSCAGIKGVCCHCPANDLNIFMA